MESTGEQTVIFELYERRGATAGAAATAGTAATATAAAVAGAAAATSITSTAAIATEAVGSVTGKDVVDSVAVGEQSAAVHADINSAPIGGRAFLQGGTAQVVGQPPTQDDEITITTLIIVLFAIKTIIKTLEADACRVRKFRLGAEARHPAGFMIVFVTEVGDLTIAACTANSTAASGATPAAFRAANIPAAFTAPAAIAAVAAIAAGSAYAKRLVAVPTKKCHACRAIKQKAAWRHAQPAADTGEIVVEIVVETVVAFDAKDP